MTAAAPLTFTAREIDELELGTLMFRRFLDVGPDEPVELVALPPSQKAIPWVAYAVGAEQQIELMREGERLRGMTGVYMVPNRIHPSIAARYPIGQWQRAEAGRAADHEIAERRILFNDLDSRRFKNISATDEEKRPVYDVADAIQEYLTKALGSPLSIGRGDSGNGLSIFVALEPSKPTEETNRRVERFLKLLAAKFSTEHVEVDTSVFNPARLCPAFGTVKTKGFSTADRPHRRTYFSCRGTVQRVPLEALA